MTENIYKCGLRENSPNLLKLFFGGKTLLVVCTSMLLALVGFSARSEFAFLAVMLWKNWDDFYFLSSREDNTITVDDNLTEISKTTDNFSQPQLNSLNEFLQQYYLQDIYIHLPFSLLMSYAMFFGVGGYLQWFVRYYYIKRRDKPEEWKCQPKRFLTAAHKMKRMVITFTWFSNERHEIVLGATCLLVNGTCSAIVSTYVINGGKATKIFFDIKDYGWLYFVISTVLYFLVQDAASYYYHRLLHMPFFYRNFHKWHHRFHSPTAFSAVAMHPVESFVFQCILFAPIFFIPMHFVTVISCFYYLYYFGLIDHSGIDINSVWPWQPPVKFHDDHHKYFHCNFGFNTTVFDRFHDTLRYTDRQYGEDIFGGKGVSCKSKKDE